MKDNIAYIHDRNAQLKELENRKADLQKQLDELQDEGRQAGARPPGSAERAANSIHNHEIRRDAPRRSVASVATEECAAMEQRILRAKSGRNFCARKNTETKTDPLTSSF